tara:strand:- start:109 stop:363 length:255 start_codon:yes stop_codon:yes gene_type:complete
MKFVVSLKNEFVVEAKDKNVAARMAASYFRQVLNGDAPDDSRGNKMKYANFYCFPMEHTGGMEGQGSNDVSVNVAKQKRKDSDE